MVTLTVTKMSHLIALLPPPPERGEDVPPLHVEQRLLQGLAALLLGGQGGVEGDPGGGEGEDGRVVAQLGQHHWGDKADLGVAAVSIGPTWCIISKKN